jgi:hypothetical protein
MNPFARTIVGFHGCRPGKPTEFARRLLVGDVSIDDWQLSANEYDWLGHGIYFWEHEPERAARWATADGIVIGAIIQLGNCLDLTFVRNIELLASAYDQLVKYHKKRNTPVPINRGKDSKLRELDCAVLNRLVGRIERHNNTRVQTVRGAFEEGKEAFPGSMLKMETHIQVAVRDRTCILGTFRPNWRI